MAATGSHRVHPVGFVHSELNDPADAPRQGIEGAPHASIEVLPAFQGALDGVQPGDHMVVLTWLHLADRSTLRVHPRDDLNTPLAGVFATRSQDRPNPIGLHDVVVEGIADLELTVAPMEAVDGTPVLDLKVKL